MLGGLKWIIPITVISYVLYTIAFICPQSTSSIFINDLTCKSYELIEPQLIPLVNLVTAKSEELVSRLHLDPLVLKVRTHANDARTKLGPIVSKFKPNAYSTKFTPLVKLVNSVVFKFNIYLAPKINIWFNKTALSLETYFSKSWNWLKFKSSITGTKLSYVIKEYISNYLTPFLKLQLVKLENSSVYLILKHYAYDFKLNIFMEKVQGCYNELMNGNNFQEKSEFLRNEFDNLINFKSKPVVVNNNDEVAEVVKDILEEITSPVSSSDSLRPSSIISSSSTASEDTQEFAQTFTDSTGEGSDGESDEPLTIEVTSTRTVTLDSEVSNPTENPTDVANTVSGKIEEELNYWDNKVHKTINLAIKNLSKDISLVVDKYIESIKPSVTDSLTDIQKVNYKNYQELNLMINEIDKDSAQIKEQNRLIESSKDSGRQFVSRQDMRNKISDTITKCNLESNEAKKLIENHHQSVLGEYFSSIQETIDVLESFAELTIQEFSNRLHTLLSILESEDDFDEELNWNSWKRFHKIKQDIYIARDVIYNEANDYQDDPSITTVPNGLEEWNSYMQSIQFHIDFLINDNEEYLKITRAKANLSFQLREGLIKELKEAGDNESTQSTIDESQTESVSEDIPTGGSSGDEDDDNDHNNNDSDDVNGDGSAEESTLNYESADGSDGTDHESEDQD